MEQKILNAINHIKYVSKKGVTIIQRFLKERSTTTFDANFFGEIIFKNFAEDPLEIHSKTFILEESVGTTLINSHNNNYSETGKSFIDEHKSR